MASLEIVADCYDDISAALLTKAIGQMHESKKKFGRQFVKLKQLEGEVCDLLCQDTTLSSLEKYPNKNTLKAAGQLLSNTDAEAAARALKNDRVSLVVCGPNDCGKSTFINALLGFELVLAHPGRCTGRVTVIRAPEKGKAESVSLCKAEGGVEKLIETRTWEEANCEIPAEWKERPELLKHQLQAKASKEEVKKYHEVLEEYASHFIVVEINHPLLAAGGQIIDIPGLEEHDVLSQLIKSKCAEYNPLILFLWSDPSFLSTTANSLKYVQSAIPNAPTFYVATKVDHKMERHNIRTGKKHNTKSVTIDDEEMRRLSEEKFRADRNLRYNELRKIQKGIVDFPERMEDCTFFGAVSAQMVLSALNGDEPAVINKAALDNFLSVVGKIGDCSVQGSLIQMNSQKGMLVGASKMFFSCPKRWSKASLEVLGQEEAKSKESIKRAKNKMIDSIKKRCDGLKTSLEENITQELVIELGRSVKLDDGWENEKAYKKEALEQAVDMFNRRLHLLVQDEITKVIDAWGKQNKDLLMTDFLSIIRELADDAKDNSVLMEVLSQTFPEIDFREAQQATSFELWMNFAFRVGSAAGIMGLVGTLVGIFAGAFLGAVAFAAVFGVLAAMNKWAYYVFGGTTLDDSWKESQSKTYFSKLSLDAIFNRCQDVIVEQFSAQFDRLMANAELQCVNLRAGIEVGSAAGTAVVEKLGGRAAHIGIAAISIVTKHQGCLEIKESGETTCDQDLLKGIWVVQNSDLKPWDVQVRRFHLPPPSAATDDNCRNEFDSLMVEIWNEMHNSDNLHEHPIGCIMDDEDAPTLVDIIRVVIG